MTVKPKRIPLQRTKAYSNEEFINSRDARALRILAEYLEPRTRFEKHGIEDTIVFFGSARFKEGSPYYEAARALAFRLTKWSKALIVFPGGFGTLDELFEIMTLRQTHKMKKHLAIVLFGAEYWNEVINFDALVRHGTIDREDLALFHRTDSVDEAYEIITRHLVEHALTERGAIL